MAPRQRLISTPPLPESSSSLEDVASATAASASPQQQQQQASAALLAPLLVAASSSTDGDADDSSTSSSNNTTANNISHVEYEAQQTLAADIAREQHDIFNLVALLFVIFTTLSNWNFGKLLHGYGPGEAWTGQHFYLNWATTILYFLVDLAWVSSVPICVKSPDVIVKHHIVAIAYLSAPVAYPEYRWFMGACLSVEINTWFLILRRVIYKRNYFNMIQDAVSICFYVSWIVIRCFIYPAILVVFLQLAWEKMHTTDRLWHWPMVFIPIHFFLCILNFKWSYDLFEPMVRRRMWLNNKEGGTGAGPTTTTISSGL